jgi:hypothetical protein
METHGLGLRRQVQRARHRYAWWLAMCAGVSASSLLALALWVSTPAPRPPPAAPAVPAEAIVIRDPTPAPVVISPQIVSPVIVVVPGAAVEPPRTPFGDLGPCPAPHRAAPRGALVQPPAEATLLGVAAAATDSRWIAAWSEEQLFVSRDGGRAWLGVLDGPGRVLDASFDCHGRVLVLRAGTGLGVRDGADERWQPLTRVSVPAVEEDAAFADDPRYQPRLVGGGRRIAVIGSTGPDLGEAIAATTADAGTTWWHTDMSWYEGADVRGAWHGETLRVLVPWTDCMSEGVRMVTITPDGSRIEELPIWTSQLALHGLDVHAVTYGCPASDGAVEGGALCFFRDRQGWSQTKLEVPVRDDVIEPTLVDGAMDVLLVDGELFPVRNGKLGRGREWPTRSLPQTVDLAGRVWGIDGDELLRR